MDKREPDTSTVLSVFKHLWSATSFRSCYERMVQKVTWRHPSASRFAYHYSTTSGGTAPSRKMLLGKHICLTMRISRIILL